VRVVQLDIDGRRVEFHSYVTVVRGLPPGAQASMLAALGSLAVGAAAAPGLVEVQGVRLDLSVETLTMLDLGGEGAHGVDVILREDELPRALRPAALSRNELDRRRETIAAQLARFEAEADRGHRARSEELEARVEQRTVLETRLQAANVVSTEARQVLHAQQERLARARQQLTDSTRDVEEAWKALEAAQANRDPLAVPAEANGNGARPLERNGDGSEVSERIEDLERRRADLEMTLIAVETVDPFLVERALEQLTSSVDVELIASADAHRIADEWVRNEAAISANEAVELVSGDASAAARHRLDVARAALFEAEMAERVREVGRQDRKALEHAHEVVVVAQDRANKRVGGKRAREKLAETQAEEQTILDRLGFDTYASFTISRSVEQADTEHEQEHRLGRLRDELFAAEDAQAGLDDAIEAELDQAALLGRRYELRDEATQILGRDPGDDLEWLLRQHRVEVTIDDDKAGRLRALLESAGLVLPDPVPQDMLVDLAEIWLDEHREASLQRDEVRGELGAVLAALRRAGAIADDEQLIQRQREIGAEVSRRQSRLAEALETERGARGEVLVAEQSVADAARIELESAAERARVGAELATAIAAEGELADADDELDDTEAAAARAEAAAATARGELAATDRLLERLTSEGHDGPPVTSAAGVEDLEWYVLSRIARHRTSSYAGSLPFVVDDAIRGVRGEALLHLLGVLEAAAGTVQIVIVTDDKEISSWTQDIGPDRAALRQPGGR
jgi:hypothetical protein